MTRRFGWHLFISRSRPGRWCGHFGGPKALPGIDSSRCRNTTLLARNSGSRCSSPVTDRGKSSTAAGPCALHRSSAAPGNTFWTLVPARVFTGAQVVESKRAHGAGVQVVARRNAGTPQACHIALHGHKWPRGALFVAIYRTRRAALSAVVDLVDLEGSGGPLWTLLWRSTAGWGYCPRQLRKAPELRRRVTALRG